jgi:hypothetical protein
VRKCYPLWPVNVLLLFGAVLLISSTALAAAGLSGTTAGFLGINSALVVVLLRVRRTLKRLNADRERRDEERWGR